MSPELLPFTLATAVFYVVCAGCSTKDCPVVVPANTSPASISVNETPLNSAQAGHLPGPIDQTGTAPTYNASSITTTIGDAQGDACVAVAFGDDTNSASFSISFACPQNTGVFDLATLDAQFCETVAGVGGGGCEPMDGAIAVHAIAMRCQDPQSTCGNLDADLTLIAGITRPFASGTAHLTYSESLEGRECYEPPIGPTGGG